MDIKLIEFKHIYNKLYMIVIYDDDTYKKFIVKDKYKDNLFNVLLDIQLSNGKLF